MTVAPNTIRVCRFSELQPTKRSFSADEVGIPEEAFQAVTAYSIYSLLAPEGNRRKAARPGAIGPEGLEVVIAECPPGQGPGLHSHGRTHEIFVCISGCYEVIWGDRGEHSAILDPCDMVAVPPGIYRRFRNVGNTDNARLLVIVQGDTKDTFNDVVMAESVGKEVEQRWGRQVLENFAKVGISFGGPMEREDSSG